MTQVANMTADAFTVTLSADERKELLTYLEQGLRDKQVEAHRTDSLDFRQYVEREVALLQSVIAKLR